MIHEYNPVGHYIEDPKTRELYKVHDVIGNHYKVEKLRIASRIEGLIVVPQILSDENSDFEIYSGEGKPFDPKDFKTLRKKFTKTIRTKAFIKLNGKLNLDKVDNNMLQIQNAEKSLIALHPEVPWRYILNSQALNAYVFERISSSLGCQYLMRIAIHSTLRYLRDEFFGDWEKDEKSDEDMIQCMEFGRVTDYGLSFKLLNSHVISDTEYVEFFMKYSNGGLVYSPDDSKLEGIEELVLIPHVSYEIEDVLDDDMCEVHMLYFNLEQKRLMGHTYDFNCDTDATVVASEYYSHRAELFGEF